MKLKQKFRSSLIKAKCNKKEIALCLYSGGLDSRLIIKLLQDKGVEVTAVHYKLPFISDKEINDNFLCDQNVQLVAIDCTRGDYLQDYVNIMLSPKYGTGAGANPCIDCKIYMFKRAKQYAQDNGFDYLATGEVPGQRPMSQLKRAQEIIQRDVDFPIVRPLADMGIEGRSRQKQMELAKNYKISYPMPGGGCLLCEKGLKKRFDKYLELSLIQEDTLQLMKVGRHFLYEEKGVWLIVARNVRECEILETYTNVIKSAPGHPAVFFKKLKNNDLTELINIANELQIAYKTGQDKELRKKFSNVKI